MEATVGEGYALDAGHSTHPGTVAPRELRARRGGGPQRRFRARRRARCGQRRGHPRSRCRGGAVRSACRGSPDKEDPDPEFAAKKCPIVFPLAQAPSTPWPPPPWPPWPIPRCMTAIIAVQASATNMKLALTTPAATSTTAITSIGMQQAIIMRPWPRPTVRPWCPAVSCPAWTSAPWGCLEWSVLGGPQVPGPGSPRAGGQVAVPRPALGPVMRGPSKRGARCRAWRTTGSGRGLRSPLGRPPPPAARPRARRPGAPAALVRSTAPTAAPNAPSKTRSKRSWGVRLIFGRWKRRALVGTAVRVAVVVLMNSPLVRCLSSCLMARQPVGGAGAHAHRPPLLRRRWRFSGGALPAPEDRGRRANPGLQGGR
jgi:hypothetical protein